MHASYLATKDQLGVSPAAVYAGQILDARPGAGKTIVDRFEVYDPDGKHLADDAETSHLKRGG